jgi:hypothetical protein
MTLADWHQAWITAIDALEMDVAAAEALLTDDQRMRDQPLTDPWRPPAGLGPLPLDLRPRADAILGRQLTAAAAITRAMITNRHQVALLNRVEGGPPVRRPAYIDCAM